MSTLPVLTLPFLAPDDEPACLDHVATFDTLLDLPDTSGRVSYLRRAEYDAATATARVVCQSCPHRIGCLAHAIATNEPGGIWGGLTRVERDRVKAGLPPIKPRKPRVRSIVTTPLDPSACGTRAGAERHRRRDLPLCDACSTAELNRWNAVRTPKARAKESA